MSRDVHVPGGAGVLLEELMAKRVAWWVLTAVAAVVSGWSEGTARGAGDPAEGASPAGGWVTIHNDFYWTDNTGARILTRSGCLAKFGDTFYWYGGNPRGFREQYCYTSTDLVHWTNRGVILRHDTDANRIDVVYHEASKQYVMILKYDGNGAHLGIATADKPEGPFTFKSQTLVDNALMGDMSVFKDDDGKLYLAYVSWAVGTNAQHGLYLFKDDYQTLDKRLYLWNIGGREANHIFKRNGIYYYGTSRTAWIDSSGTNYYTARSLEGPWSEAKPMATPGSTNSWDSQVDFVFPFKGSKGTVYMFAGDRWVKDLPKGRNGDYVWLPMEFEGDAPVVHYFQDWELNVATGEWRKFDPARNLAAGKAATASSASGENVAAHVTDATTYENYLESRWESGVGDAQWISVDLGKVTEVNRVILKWGTTAAKAFKVQVSTDGTGWKDVYSTNLGSSYTVTDETFPTQSARYVRMIATERAAVPAAGGRGRGGRGNRGAATASEAQPVATAPTTVPTPAGYTLFEFQVLKD
jgi:hypothetical protein